MIGTGNLKEVKEVSFISKTQNSEYYANYQKSIVQIDF